MLDPLWEVAPSEKRTQKVPALRTEQTAKKEILNFKTKVGGTQEGTCG